MMNYFYFLKEMAPDDKAPIRIPLYGTEVCIGRTITTSLKKYSKVSRRHALFMKNNNSWAIKDLHSRNALYVNFTRMDSKWRTLDFGDVIGFGTSSLDDKAGFVCTFCATKQIKQEPFELRDEEEGNDCMIVKDPSETASNIERVSSDVKIEVDSDNSIDSENMSLDSWNVTETSESDSDNSIEDEVSSLEAWNVTETSQNVNSETIDDKTGSLNVAEKSPETGLLEPLNVIENSQNINFEAINDESGLLEPLSVTETLPKIKIETIDEETGPLNITETSPNGKSDTDDNGVAQLQTVNVTGNSQIVSNVSDIKFQKNSDTISGIMLESWNVTETSQNVNSETIDDKTGSLNVAEKSPNVKFAVIENETGLLEPLNVIENSQNINFEAINDDSGLLEPLSVTETLSKIKIETIDEETGPLNVTETWPKIKNGTIDEETDPLNITETSPNGKSDTDDNGVAQLQTLNVTENSQIVSNVGDIKFQKNSDTILKNETVSVEKLRVTGLSYIKVEQDEDIENNASNTKHGKKSSYVNFDGPQEVVTPKQVNTERDNSCLFYENDEDSVDSTRHYNWEDLPSPDKLYRSCFQRVITVSENDTRSSVKTTEPIVSSPPTYFARKFEEKVLYDENSINDLNVSDNFLKNSSTVNLCKNFDNETGLLEPLNVIENSQNINFEAINDESGLLEPLGVTETLPKIKIVTIDEETGPLNVTETWPNTLRDTELQVIRHCSVKLVKCESKYFDWPSDVKSKPNNCVQRNKFLETSSSSDSYALDLSLPKEAIKTRYYTNNAIKGGRPAEMQIHEFHQHLEIRDSLIDLNCEQNERNHYNSSVAQHSSKLSKRKISQSNKNPYMSPPRKIKKCQAILDKSISIAKSNNNTGKVRFIEPMPITRRPKYVRGREEWFPERYGSFVPSLEDEIIAMAVGHETIDYNPTTDEFDTQNNYKSSHGNEETSYKNTRRNEQKFHEIDHHKEQRSYENTHCNKQKFNESTPNAELPDSDKTNYNAYVSYSQRNRPAVARRPDKYGSRMSFLVDAAKATDTRPKRNKLHSKQEVPKLRDKIFDSTIVKACTASRPTDHNYLIAGHNPSMTDNPSFGGGKKETIDDTVAFIRNFPQQSNPDEPPLREHKKLEQNPQSASASENDSSDYSNIAIIAPRTVASSAANKEETRIKTLISEKNSCDYNVIPIIVQILNWNPIWLKEQNSTPKPPPLISKTVKFLSLWYKSFEEYADAYTPAVLLDIWEMLYRNHTPVLYSNNTKTFYFSINAIRTHNAVMELQCQATFSGNYSSRPTEGSVALLIATEKQSGRKVTLFGYIHTHESGACNYIPQKSDFRSELSSQEMMNPVIFSVFVKKRFYSFQKSAVAYSIVNIRDKIHLIEALDFLKVSPLSKAIFNPNQNTLTMCDRSSPDEVEDLKNQILHLGPKVILVNTPAATGKTSLIVQLIDSLHNTVKNSKVWICSSSVTTLDEIGLRLVKHQSDIPYSLEFVRTGPCLDMHPELVCNSLSRKVSDLLCKDTAKRIEKIQALECQINETLFQIPKPDDETGNNSSLQLIINEYRALKEESLNPLNSCQKKLEQKILKDSLVIMSTLDRAMELRTSTRPTCCIVDEAQQCSELDVLQCLISGVDKLVLIGDIYQMPMKVLSKYALEHGYGRSMFERLCSVSRRLFMRDQVLTVNHQHRMDREICLFSSMYFYQRRLITSTAVNHNWPLQPYLLYDIVVIEKNVDVQMKAGWKETIFRFMCSKIFLLCPTATLGIVTSAKDVGPCSSFFSQNAMFRDVEVNTVDKFQGREKDVIILFHIEMQDGDADYVECARRLNVAMTRARHSLIIFGHLSSLTVRFRHWKALLEDAKMRRKYVGIASLKHIPAVFGLTINR